jgi:hypothetical protein
MRIRFRPVGLAGLLALLALGAVGGCIAGRGGGAVVPARYDIGAYGSDRGGGGFHGSAGIHWASMSSNPRTPVDVGVGWLLEVQPGADDADPQAGTIARVSETPSGTAAPTDAGVTTHGPYLELAQRISGSRHQRTFVGGRAEWLFRDDGSGSESGVGLSARISRELFTTTRENGHSGAASGALAIGLFLEVGHRRIEDFSEDTVVAGVTFRLPAAVFGGGCR